MLLFSEGALPEHSLWDRPCRGSGTIPIDRQREVLNMVRKSAWLLVLIAIVTTSSGSAAQVCGPRLDGDVADVYYESNVVFWQPRVELEGMVLTVSAPCEEIVKTFGPKDEIYFDLKEVAREVDGSYSWELRAMPRVDPGVRGTLEEARASGTEDEVWWSLWDKGAISDGPFVQSASFSVVEGKIVDPASGEEKRAVVSRAGAPTASATVAATPAGGFREGATGSISAKDVLHYDDVIVTGSICAGFDCANGESFGYDTIRVKENNVRIQFDDTSSAASYPKNNWQIRASDHTNGGASYLGFVDQGESGTSVDGDLVFAVEAGAPENALWIDDYGRAGFGTKTPATAIHAVDGDTPTVRLDQDGSYGFAAQRWDMAGNETNFFIRDVDHGSHLVFRIQPGAPSNSLAIRSTGNVGIGTWSPQYDLDIDDGTSDAANFVVRGTSGSMILQDQDAASGRQAAQNLVSAGTWRLRGLSDDRATQTVRGITLDLADGDVGILCDTSLSADLTVGSQSSCSSGTRSTLNAGDTTFTASSSRAIKENIQPKQVHDILDRISKVGVYEYDFIDGPKGRLGLMAEDFHEVFERGSDKVLSGQEVQMALWLAVQELAQRTSEGRMAELERENDDLIARQQDLERKIQRLEARLAAAVE